MFTFCRLGIYFKFPGTGEAFIVPRCLFGIVNKFNLKYVIYKLCLIIILSTVNPQISPRVLGWGLIREGGLLDEGSLPLIIPPSPL